MVKEKIQNQNPKPKYSFSKKASSTRQKKYLIIGIVTLLAIAVVYFSGVSTGQIISSVSRTINNPLGGSEASAIKFSHMDFMFYNTPSDLGLSGEVPPDMFYCYSQLIELEKSGHGMGVVRVGVHNSGSKKINLSTSTLHKIGEVELYIYNEAEKDKFGHIINMKTFQRTCSMDGVMNYITSRQAGNTDPIVLKPGEGFEFIGIVETSSSRNDFCGKVYTVNMAGTINNGREINTYDLDSRTITVKC